MDFCIITPSAGLERYATLSKTHLVLAHIQDPLYRNFYLKRRQEGDTIILDNGAYEGKMDVKTFLDAIEFYKPQVAVLPDRYLAPWRESLGLAMEFYSSYGSSIHCCRWMFVPQAEPGDLLGFIQGIINANYELPIDWIALPRCLATHIHPVDFIRAKMCRFIRQTWPELTVHALGMAAGDIEELRELQSAGCNSIDSSAPVWRGWNGVNIKMTQGKTVVSECDFLAPLNPIFDDVILYNLKACNVDTSKTRD